jgi:hypothetical protein
MPRRRIATLTILIAIASAVGLATAGSAAATTNLVVNSGWQLFTFGGVGSHASGDPYKFVAAAPATLEVTDGYDHGDQFAVYDNGVLLGNTSSVATTPGNCSNPDVCFADPAYSHATFNLPIGLHSITIVAIASPWGGGGAWLRVDAPVACTTTITGTHGSVTATSGLTCIVQATINGGVSVAQGGSLLVLHSTVSGSISAHGTPYFAVCASHTGSIGASAATGPVIIGDPSDGCAGNTISGSVTAANNTGGLTIENNKITGSLTAAGNASPVTISGNTH